MGERFARAVPTRRTGPRGHGAARHSRARAQSASKTRVNALMAHPTGPPQSAWNALVKQHEASGLLLHPGPHLVETGLGAGFVLGPAALSAVCATEADGPDEIIAGH